MFLIVLFSCVVSIVSINENQAINQSTPLTPARRTVHRDTASYFYYFNRWTRARDLVTSLYTPYPTNRCEHDTCVVGVTVGSKRHYIGRDVTVRSPWAPSMPLNELMHVHGHGQSSI